ncbi:unnamed protein product [Adineta steineri]|uniref:Transmembrane protein n=1 Tax=Adineta steineri TaxID=433720 RepID=A0A818R873_9BILA|nr:unnamed protein product [Adineta steineri]CAF3653494.1 unnamed protein product [Adineta steineri]
MMNSSNDSEGALKIISIISLSFGSCCLLLCCAGYTLSKKTNKQKNQIHFINNQHDSDANAHIFTIDVNDTQSHSSDVINPPYYHYFDVPPPPYEAQEEPSSKLQHESIIGTS